MHVLGDEHGAVSDEIARAVAWGFVARNPRLAPHVDVLLSDARLGVSEARLRYDSSRGASFRTYAMRRARGAVLDGMRDRSPLSRGEVGRGQGLGDLPAARQTPLAIGCQVDPAEQVDLFEQVDLRLTLAAAIEHELTSRERYVIEEFFFRSRRLHEIGAALELTEARVCQIKQAALAKLRDYLQ